MSAIVHVSALTLDLNLNYAFYNEWVLSVMVHKTYIFISPLRLNDNTFCLTGGLEQSGGLV